MKELTRITTIQITSVSPIENENDVLPEESSEKGLEKSIKELFGIDDVNVKVQNFITGEEE